MGCKKVIEISPAILRVVFVAEEKTRLSILHPLPVPDKTFLSTLVKGSDGYSIVLFGRSLPALAVICCLLPDAAGRVGLLYAEYLL